MLTIKGNTRPIEARGTIDGPGLTLQGATALGIALGTIIDRAEFGLAFNAPLPTGGSAVATTSN